ncbi:MAG: hypothetical protein CL930_06115 [Deltaproteobacteria bacterium]|nr:hypothetical protein [Deltaproteobacteria bacterium]
MTEKISPNTGLTAAQTESYATNGFVSGIPVLNESQTQIALRKLVDLECKEVEIDSQRWTRHEYQPWSDRKSAWWHWFMPMCTHPAIISAVQSILGPNILIRNADIFVKPRMSDRAINWHVDSTAPFEQSQKMLTAWLALTDSSAANGCMEWIPGSHKMVLPNGSIDKETLTFRQNAIERANVSQRVSNILKPGELALHHFRTAHRSGGNFTQKPRIGLVIRFIATDTDANAAETGKGFLAAGKNEPGHFDIAKTFPVTWRRVAKTQLS